MHQSRVEIVLGNQYFELLPEKAAYWKEQNILLIADVHAGKASHFRNNGIPLSTDHLLKDLNTIQALIKRLNPNKIIFLGDLYHTNSNIENKLIDNWLCELNVEIELIIGNHDRHSISSSQLKTMEAYSLNGILLSHEPEQTDLMNICGHLHPSYTLSGKGRQHIKMPAFYHSESYLVLPAFGSINGGKMYKDLVKESAVILVSNEGLITAKLY